MTRLLNKDSLVLKLVTAAVSLALFVIIGEVVCRAVNPDVYFHNQFFPLNRDINFPDIYQRDYKLFWKFRTNFDTESKKFSRLSYRINSFGLRGHEPSEKSNGYRILVMGNSCTFGWGIPDSLTFVSQLSNILDTALPFTTVDLINGGVPGYSSYQGRIVFEELAEKLKPQMVLLMYGWNDHWPAGQNIADAEQKMPWPVILKIQNSLGRLKSYQFLRKILLQLVEGEIPPVDIDQLVGRRRVSRGEFRANLSAIAAEARARSITPILISPPIASIEEFFGNKKTKLQHLHQEYQRVISSVSLVDSIPLIDLQPVFDISDNFFDDAKADPIHFNARGHEKAAAAIAEVVTAIVQNSSAQN